MRLGPFTNPDVIVKLNEVIMKNLLSYWSSSKQMWDIIESPEHLTECYQSHLRLFLRKNIHADEKAFKRREIADVKKAIDLINDNQHTRYNKYYGVLNKYLDLLLSDYTSPTSIEWGTTQEPKQFYNNLKEIFTIDVYYDESIEMLSKVIPPIKIGPKTRTRSALVAWLRSLEKWNVVYPGITPRDYVRLLLADDNFSKLVTFETDTFYTYDDNTRKKIMNKATEYAEQFDSLIVKFLKVPPKKLPK